MVTFYATDTAGTIESTTTNNNGTVSSANPTFTIQVDTIAPTVSCTPPAPAWQATDVTVPCTARDNAGGSGLAGPASFNVSTAVPAGTETSSATIAAVTVQDIAGNTSAPQGPFGPFEVDKNPPAITGPTISPSSPTYGQTITASYSCGDLGSGVALCGPSGSPAITPAVANTGTLTFTAPGSVGPHTITINAQDAVGNQSTPSSITYTVGQATPTMTWTAPAAITYGTALGGTQLDATASVPGTFAYTPAAGAVLAAGPQTLSVTFTPTDATDYTTATATVPLVVSPATPTITWATPAAIPYGTALSAAQLNASASVPGTFVYNPPAGTVLTAGPHPLSVTFTPTDATDYSTATANVTLLVNQVTPAITWATPGAITYGTALGGAQLDATASVPGTFLYSPAAGTVLNAGSQLLSASFTPTDATDYSTAKASVSLQVNQATPIISWAAPASIPYGTALSSIQLDATANVPGTFVYTPAAGTVLPPGTQTLSVIFTPTSSNFTPATAQVMLVVTQAVVTVSPTSINFGTVEPGKAKTVNVTVSSSGNAALKIKGVSIKCEGSCDSDDFTAKSSCPVSLAVGSSCNIAVTYHADDSGTRTATLYINDNALGSPQAVTLSGTKGK